MKKLLTLTATITALASLSSTIVACSPQINFGGTITPGGNNNNGDGDEDGNGNTNTDSCGLSDLDITRQTDLLTSNSIKNQVGVISNFNNIEEINEKLTDLVSKKCIYGVGALEASLKPNSVTDIIVFITTVTGFAMYPGQEYFEIENAIIENKVVNSEAIIAAASKIKNLDNLDAVNDLLKAVKPAGANLIASLVEGSETNVQVVIELEAGWTIDDPNNQTFIIEDAISVEEVVAENALAELARLFNKIVTLYPIFEKDEATSIVHEYFVKNSNSDFISMQRNEDPTLIDQIQIVAFVLSYDADSAWIHTYYVWSIEDQGNLKWETKYSSFVAEIKIKYS